MATLNEAYEVLSSPELRARFDAGDDPNDPMSQQGGHPFASGFGGGHPFASFFQQTGGGQGGFPGGQGDLSSSTLATRDGKGGSESCIHVQQCTLVFPLKQCLYLLSGLDECTGFGESTRPVPHITAVFVELDSYSRVCIR
jgi:DnaJ-class molecular chaperone